VKADRLRRVWVESMSVVAAVGYVRATHADDDGLLPWDPAVYARLPKVHRDESRAHGLELELPRLLGLRWA